MTEPLRYSPPQLVLMALFEILPLPLLEAEALLDSALTALHELTLNEATSPA